MSENARALSKAEAYPHPVEGVRVQETHTSWVFLTGKFAYKLKKPIKFGEVLDYRSLEQRKKFCEREVKLDKALPGGVYLSVEPVKRTSGGLRVGNKFHGDTVDYAVKARQLPEADILSHLVRRNQATPAIFGKLAQLLNNLHKKTRGKRGMDPWASMDSLQEKVEENFHTAKALGLDFPKGYSERVVAWPGKNARVLESRARKYSVEGHGDFRADNIFAISKGTKLDLHVTDRVEFSELLLHGDEAEDVAFLAMDLDHLGRSDLGEIFLDEYIRLSGDMELRGVLNYYKSYRAFVRAKVHAFYAQQAKSDSTRHEHLEKARSYLLLAQAYPF